MSTHLRSVGVAATSAAAVALVALAVTYTGGHVLGEAVGRTPSSSNGGSVEGVSGVTAAPSSGASDVSSATIEALASDGLVAQASRSRAPRIGLDDAVHRARSEFPGMLGDKSPNVEASAMSVTIAEYGEQLQADPDKASEIRLAVDHRLAWVLIFDNVDVPLMGSFNEGEMDSLPTPLPSRFVVLIDGETGAFLHARTF